MNRLITKEHLTTYRDRGRVLIGAEDWVYLLPHPGLRSYISNYTVSFPAGGYMTDDYAVIPHGCATLVFLVDAGSVSAELFGPCTKPIAVGRRANRRDMIFIAEFQPAGYYAFSGMPQKELCDCVLPFDAVNPALCRRMAETIESAKTVEDLIAGADRLFLAHLKAAFYRQEFSLASGMIVGSGGLASVKELSGNVFYSERHLGRVFGEYLGMGVKPFSRLVRVNKAIRLLRRRDYGLARVSLETGFYDTAHLIHDFRAITGVTPEQYRANMSDFYSEIAKF